ncbi:MAG: aminoglycoside phosphotransferase family protein [bacterium]
MKKDILKTLDKDYLLRFFKNKKDFYFPGSKNIADLKIKRISPLWAKQNCLAKYVITFADKKTKTVRGTAGSGPTKKGTVKIADYLYHHGFNQGNLIISRPLDFIAAANLFFYEEAPGQTLLEKLRTVELSEAENYFSEIAAWLTKLHALPSKKFKKARFIGVKGYAKIFSQIEKLTPELKKELIPLEEVEFIDKVWEKDNVLIHNDFYLRNIIVNNKRIYGIDFDLAGIGPRLMDLASFYGSFEFPPEIWNLNFANQEKKELQEVFLKSYCQLNKINYGETKKELKKFLLKIFLDQVHYYASFSFKCWRFLSEQEKQLSVLKIKKILSQAKKYL